MREPIKSGHVSVFNFDHVVITFSSKLMENVKCDCLGDPPVCTNWKQSQPTLGFSQNHVMGSFHTVCSVSLCSGFI